MMKKIITLIMCLICCYSYAFIIDGDGGSGWIAEPTSIIISGGGSSSGGWEEYDPAKTYYTVTLLDNDRTTILASKLVEEGSDVTIDFTPVKSGHVFTTWTDANNVPVTQITNISADTRLFAMWDNGRFSITYYVDGEYQGIQFYDENDTITPLAAPSPYDAEVDSCFVGWYNIPQNFKMPAHDIIATATIDESYYINYNWIFDGGASGGNSHAYRGYVPYYRVLSVVDADNNHIYKIPPVHNSRVVESAYFLNPSTISSYFNNNNHPLPTEMYIGGDNITKDSYLGSNQFNEALYSNIASLTVYLPNVASEPYVDHGVTVNPGILLRSMFTNALNMKYVDLSVFNVNTLGGMAGSTMLAGCEIRSTVLETYKLPETIQTYYGHMVNYCRDPINIPDVATFTWIYGNSSNGMYKPNGLNYVVASDTRFIFQSNANARNSYFINQGQNISFTFEGGYLPVNAVNTSYTPFAYASTITIYYHGNCGEWQDPSFKENSTLWGTLSQYTWVDLDAETE